MKMTWALGITTGMVLMQGIAFAQSPIMMMDVDGSSTSSVGTTPALVPMGLTFGPEGQQRMLFAADDGDIGAELWETDGTEAGTWLRADIMAGPVGSNPVLGVIVNNVLYFSANRPGFEGDELWKLDLSAPSNVPQLAWDINPGSASGTPRSMVALGNIIVFHAAMAGTGREMCVFNTVTQTGTMLANSAPGVASSSMTVPVLAGDEVWYIGGAFGRELFKTRGTPATTVRVADFTSVATSAIGSLCAVGISPASPRVSPSTSARLFMPVRTAAEGVELWRSDGTAGGTTIVTDFYPGTSGSHPVLFGSSPPSSGNLGTLYFSAISSTTGREMRALGPLESTPRLLETRPGGYGGDPTALILLPDGRAIFVASTGRNGATQERELFITSGSAATTSQLCDLVPGTATSEPEMLAFLGEDVLLCSARSEQSSSTSTREVWRVNIPPRGSTTAGTATMLSNYPSVGGIKPMGFVRVGDRVVFSGEYPGYGREPWSVLIPPPCVPAAIQSPPVGGVWIEPGPVQLSVVASGRAPFTYQWFKEGQEIHDDGFYTIGAQTASLMLDHAGWWNNGNYSVRVENECGTVFSPTIEITLRPPPLCDPLDFNNDGNIDPSDIDAYFSILGEGSCIPEFYFCNDLDFNNDDTIDPTDIDAYFSLLGEGPCIG